MNKPYVVSQDLGFLLGNWSARTGFLVNPTALACYRNTLNQALQAVFGCIEVVPEAEIAFNMEQLVAASGLPTVSLDGVYHHSVYQLAITRQVTPDGDDLGLGSRFGYPTIAEQLTQLVERLQQAGHTTVALVDDVVFSGDLMTMVRDWLAAADIAVPLAIAGVAVGDGWQKLHQNGLELRAFRSYEQVVDEVCERDFLPGATQSGRTIYPFGPRDAGLPYLLPFGRPREWASVPDNELQSFSRACLLAAADLYYTIGQESGQPVRGYHLERVVGLADNGANESSFHEWLIEQAETLMPVPA